MTPADYVVSRWSGGTTCQIAIAPCGALYTARDFLWRVSAASVEQEEAEYTALPDYERLLSVTRGKAQLQCAQREAFVLGPDEIYRFDGAERVCSRGFYSDFNLMLHKGQCSGSLQAFRLAEYENRELRVEETDTVLLLYCIEGKGVLSFGSETAIIKNQEAVMAREIGKTQGRLCAGSRARFLLARISEPYGAVN